MSKMNFTREFEIYPKPQNIEYLSNGWIDLNEEINVVISEDYKERLILKLRRILEYNNITYKLSNSKDEDKLNIVITEDSNCGSGNTEGYTLKISDDYNKNGYISIKGVDESGIYYGILTLGQIIEQKLNNKIPKVYIEDYPEIRYRGFIEGFYGYPWSHSDRISLIKDTSKFKMNTYIYAPKDDPYHRFSWKELYPKDKAKEINELASICENHNMNFCWTIHPGDTLKFIEEDFNLMIEKFEQLYTLGVRQFGIFFDDTEDWKSGKIQAEWINRIDREFIKAKGDIASIIVVSARYNSAWGPEIDVYFKPFVENLNSDIQVMWTGHGTMSNISKDVFEWPKEQTKVDKNVVVWWNYPVNDYCDSRLLMAPMHNLNPNLDNVNGFFSNPMNQAEASKVALFSIADYTWNTDAFEYMKSWEISIEKLVPKASKEFKRFAANICYLKEDGGISGSFEFDESWYLKKKIDGLREAIEINEDVELKANELMKEFETIVLDCDILRNSIDNIKLLEEIEVFLGAYKAIGEAGVAAIKSYIEKDNYSLAKEKLELAEDFKIERLKEDNKQISVKKFTVSVGEQIIKPIITDIINS
ncbi:MAG: beta-N-acetylhexosaminidase family protein [Peptostreptococcaceae bacterium]